LTFDDGPDANHTNALLDVLAELNVPSTFFVLGSRVDAHPGLLRRIARDGHEIGNHTYRHAYLPAHTGDTVLRELAQTDRVVARITGRVRVAWLDTPRSSLVCDRQRSAHPALPSRPRR
jgi:peptidoglycan-N-acetylglucosamine deacetylase